MKNIIKLLVKTEVPNIKENIKTNIIKHLKIHQEDCYYYFKKMIKADNKIFYAEIKMSNRDIKIFFSINKDRQKSIIGFKFCIELDNLKLKFLNDEYQFEEEIYVNIYKDNNNKTCKKDQEQEINYNRNIIITFIKSVRSILDNQTENTSISALSTMLSWPELCYNIQNIDAKNKSEEHYKEFLKDIEKKYLNKDIKNIKKEEDSFFSKNLLYQLRCDLYHGNQNISHYNLLYNVQNDNDSKENIKLPFEISNELKEITQKVTNKRSYFNYYKRIKYCLEQIHNFELKDNEKDKDIVELKNNIEQLTLLQCKEKKFLDAQQTLLDNQKNLNEFLNNNDKQNKSTYFLYLVKAFIDISKEQLNYIKENISKCTECQEYFKKYLQTYYETFKNDALKDLKNKGFGFICRYNYIIEKFLFLVIQHPSQKCQFQKKINENINTTNKQKNKQTIVENICKDIKEQINNKFFISWKNDMIIYKLMKEIFQKKYKEVEKEQKEKIKKCEKIFVEDIDNYKNICSEIRNIISNSKKTYQKQMPYYNILLNIDFDIKNSKKIEEIKKIKNEILKIYRNHECKYENCLYMDEKNTKKKREDININFLVESYFDEKCSEKHKKLIKKVLNKSKTMTTNLILKKIETIENNNDVSQIDSKLLEIELLKKLSDLEKGAEKNLKSNKSKKIYSFLQLFTNKNDKGEMVLNLPIININIRNLFYFFYNFLFPKTSKNESPWFEKNHENILLYDLQIKKD
ncbi:hypothetical protein CWO85_02575 [Candidatus Phytoplasma ziziphi]|uniref:Uncharacterized protein n=1 Tax=Ziziphus jujuba witches'-broom phytoplasma TaxID=135727 RepID=A0A660HMV8_ZIZJU|nr:hypothetical protein [Candidatus Phytoplasma ziziphi]AYJ01373.1 hypothetical protein CWO85_02575 [Candidatus Phytoplasma ziziphi]